LDKSKLPEILEKLRENTQFLNTWECDRLEEWTDEYERWGMLSDNKLACLEKMYLKVP
jgi:hypothetical protein